MRDPCLIPTGLPASLAVSCWLTWLGEAKLGGAMTASTGGNKMGQGFITTHGRTLPKPITRACVAVAVEFHA